MGSADFVPMESRLLSVTCMQSVNISYSFIFRSDALGEHGPENTKQDHAQRCCAAQQELGSKKMSA